MVGTMWCVGVDCVPLARVIASVSVLLPGKEKCDARYKLCREGNGKDRALAQLATCIDFAAVLFDDRAGDGKAKADAASVARTIFAHAVEAIEDFGEVIGGDADTSVGYSDDGLTREYPLHLDASLLRGELDGVIEQDANDATERLGVAGDWTGATGVNGKLDVPGIGEDAHFLDSFLDSRGEVHGLQGEASLANVGTGEKKEIGEQLSSAFGFRVNAMPGSFVLFNGAGTILHEFGSCLDNGNRGAEFVGGIGGEFGNAVEGGFKAMEHVVEHRREPVELIADAGGWKAGG